MEETHAASWAQPQRTIKASYLSFSRSVESADALEWVKFPSVGV
jgi:hypothetical protein